MHEFFMSLILTINILPFKCDLVDLTTLPPKAPYPFILELMPPKNWGGNIKIKGVIR